MRVLYEAEITADAPLEILGLAFGRFHFTEEGRRYAESLVDACARHHVRIDREIEATLENWDLARLPAVERSILRLAAAELLYFRETPVEVILDEALRLAHRYGEPRGAGFVNGVLDALGRRTRKREMHSREASVPPSARRAAPAGGGEPKGPASARKGVDRPRG